MSNTSARCVLEFQPGLAGPEFAALPLPTVGENWGRSPFWSRSCCRWGKFGQVPHERSSENVSVPDLYFYFGRSSATTVELHNQELKIMLAIIVAEENISPTIAALRDVAGQARNHNSGNSRHEATSLGSVPA